ncbi:MAG: glycogen debranching protein [Desulfobacteraceae bacterium]|nr:MAG: glycogen debranching protein [Desulfobacteraceae bacterium]
MEALRNSPVRIQEWSCDQNDADALVTREWLVTNGLGGYASGTVSGVSTRRYHGLLIAALPSPFGRMVMLDHLCEEIRLPDGKSVLFGGEELTHRGLELYCSGLLRQFVLDMGLPVWRFEISGVVLEKRVLMPYMQNTVQITYRLLEGPESVQLQLRPSLAVRNHEDEVDQSIAAEYAVRAVNGRYEVSSGPNLPELRIRLLGESSAFTLDGGSRLEFYYRRESERGYKPTGGLWSPGVLGGRLSIGREMHLIASTEDWDTITALHPEEATKAETVRRRGLLESAHANLRSEFGAELVLAADQFVVAPAARVEDRARLHALGEDARTIIAGYHWFTDWGRDSMISLEGLALLTGRHREAAHVLQTFAQHIRYGLIPNHFTEREGEGIYNTADATLWFFQALERYISITGDRKLLRSVLPALQEVVRTHFAGTRFGIGVDPEDGLLKQGEQRLQLTWMDAKVEDWVVTPRRGKAVEINALWYNALRLLGDWLRDEQEKEADELDRAAQRVFDAFNRKFWFEEGGYLFDVVDGEQGNDRAFRPNQVFALSLTHPVLAQNRWTPILEKVRERLLTPYGLRSLSHEHPEYKAKYFGDLRSRDAAYHQGTVWAWLIGPFIDGWLRVHPGDIEIARSFLEGFKSHMDEACVGSISEIFDAEPPFIPRGCIAQAWSVAEVLRCWVKTAGSSGASGLSGSSGLSG